MRRFRAFTLIEVLIVVVILGILSAIVVPQFSGATDQATSAATLDQLVKVREALGVYFVRNGSRFPDIQQGVATWGQVVSTDYLRQPPQNFWVTPSAKDVIVFGAGPDAGYQAAHGWIYNPTTGDLWAGSFDANDKPYPKP